MLLAFFFYPPYGFVGFSLSDGSTGRVAGGLSGEVCRWTIFHSFPINLKTSVILPEALSSFPSNSCDCFHLHVA
jgi:hypothetical protein